MTSTFSSHITENAAITFYDFDPDATAAADVAWVDMRDYNELTVAFIRTVGAGALTFLILGNSASDGTGTDVTIKTVTVSAEPDAVGDYIFATVTEDDIVSASESGARYLSANLALGVATDEGVVAYIRSGAKHPQSGLTSDSVA